MTDEILWAFENSQLIWIVSVPGKKLPLNWGKPENICLLIQKKNTRTSTVIADSDFQDTELPWGIQCDWPESLWCLETKISAEPWSQLEEREVISIRNDNLLHSCISKKADQWTQERRRNGVEIRNTNMKYSLVFHMGDDRAIYRHRTLGTIFNQCSGTTK